MTLRIGELCWYMFIIRKYYIFFEKHCENTLSKPTLEKSRLGESDLYFIEDAQKF